MRTRTRCQTNVGRGVKSYRLQDEVFNARRPKPLPVTAGRQPEAFRTLSACSFPQPFDGATLSISQSLSDRMARARHVICKQEAAEE
jgi:hypothetical protein